MSEDGVYRWVISQQDAEFVNWLGTTGLDHGFVTFRASYATPPEDALRPELQARKVPVTELAELLPDDAKRSSPQQREEAILMRHRHVQRRYRQY